MNDLKWHLFTLRTQIEMRMLQLDLSRRLRTKIVNIIARLTDIPRLTSFARRMDSRKKRMPGE